MQISEIKKIQDALRNFCNLKGSQNKGAAALGISNAIVSKILQDKVEGVTDEFFRNLSAKLGLTREGELTWQVAETKAYRRMAFCIEQAQEASLTMGVTGWAGMGKTEAIEVYVAEHQNAYHLCCSEYWNRKTFLSELLKCMGTDCTGASVQEMVEDVINGLKRKDHPVIIMDEADKLSDSVLYFFISIYNRLEDRCGLMLVATDYLEKRIKKGLRNNKKGYQEIYSRLGRKFIELPALDDEDVMLVCAANGMKDGKAVNSLLKDLKQDDRPDLRRVKRAVWAWLKQNKKQEEAADEQEDANE